MPKPPDAAKIARIEKRLKNGDNDQQIAFDEHSSPFTVGRIRARLNIPAIKRGCSGKPYDFTAVDEKIKLGWSSNRIIRELHVSSSTVVKRRIELGIESDRSITPPETANAILALAESPYLFSLSHIGRIVGVDKATVRRIITINANKNPRRNDDQTISTGQNLHITSTKTRAARNRQVE